MPSVTGLSLIRDTFGILNVFLPGESIPDADAQFALRTMNRMVGGWSQRTQLIPVIAREVFDLTADKGGPSNPYTIGVGGNLNTAKPANQASVTGAALLLTASDPGVEVPLGLYTDDAYDAIAIKELTSGQPTGLYYNPTYATDRGTINLWPVPDNATNDLVLYLQKAITRFTDTSTTYYVPEGYDDALIYNLARRLAGPYGKRLSAEDTQLAVTALGIITRANTKLSDLVNDATFAGSRRTLYNIESGAGG